MKILKKTVLIIIAICLFPLELVVGIFAGVLLGIGSAFEATLDFVMEL